MLSGVLTIKCKGSYVFHCCYLPNKLDISTHEASPKGHIHSSSHTHLILTQGKVV